MTPDAVVSGHDAFHAVTTEDCTWTETSWFAAIVPERRMGLWLYPLFRPELGVMSCGVYVWAPGVEEAWELPYYRVWWHMPIPDGIEPTRFTLPNGLAYECLDPLMAYRATYEDGDELSVDLTFRGLHAPHEVGVVEGRHGHLDQLGRVTGEVVLRGERIAVDCIEMRDRTWSPRRESRQRMHLTYSYGADADGSGFLMSTRFDHRLGRRVQLGGFLLEDGRTHDLTDVTCEVQRDASLRPERIALAASGPEDRPVVAEGEVLSRFAFPANPWLGWTCLVRWTLPDGRQVHGEHQDAWSAAMLRAERARTAP